MRFGPKLPDGILEATPDPGLPMCGRYVSPDEASIEREFNLVHAEWNFPASFNVAPTQAVPVVRMHQGRRSGARLHWGLIPFFAHGIPPKYSTINARIETVRTSASYRGPWKRNQRCLVVALGFYEWQLQVDGRTKVPYYIHLNDQDMFAFAGLWDSSRTDQGEVIESCVHITMPANRVRRGDSQHQASHARHLGEGRPRGVAGGVSGGGVGGLAALPG